MQSPVHAKRLIAEARLSVELSPFERTFLTVLENQTATFNDINLLIDLHQKLYHRPVDLKKLFDYSPAAQANFEHIIHQQWLSISFADAQKKEWILWVSDPYRFDLSFAGVSFIATL